MLHPDLATQLAQDHIAELHAEAARARLIRRLTALRRRRVVADPAPTLSLVAAPAPHTADAPADPARVA